MGKEFYKRHFNANILEKIQHKSLFNIFRNKGISRRTIQSYVEKRYVEIIYAQWKL